MAYVDKPTHSPYLTQILNAPETIISQAQETLKDIDFHAIVVTGVSGMLLGPTLAYMMDKSLAIVRNNESGDCHAITDIEHSMNDGDDWIFVDDLIASGQTIKRVEAAMQVAKFKPMNGRYLYNSDHFEKGGWMYNRSTW